MIRLKVAALVTAGALVGASFVSLASAATPNDTACRKVVVSGQSTQNNVLNYDACRFDRLDAAVAAGQAGGTSSSSPSASPTVTPKPSASPTPSVTPTPSASPTPTPSSSTTGQPAGVCKPGSEIVKFNGPGSAGLGQYGQGNYDASAETWGVNGYAYKQVMGVCTNDAWYVDGTYDNSKGDGAVKAYPSMRRIYHDWSTNDFSKDPRLSSFPKLTIDFAVTNPASCASCIYDTASDHWLNGIASSTSTELMIWTRNQGQTPYGSKVASGIQIGGHTYDLWSGNSNHYVAYVATDTNDITSGTQDVKAFVADLVSRNRIGSTGNALDQTDPRLGQLSYGVEFVSTGGVSKHWDFTKFTVHDN